MEFFHHQHHQHHQQQQPQQHQQEFPQHSRHHRAHGRYHLNLIHEHHPHVPKLQAHHFSESGSHTSKMDLRHRMPPVYDQGQLGSCTANALCAIYAFNDPGWHGSRLFVYFNERQMEGTVSEDSGASLSDGVEALHTYGLCSESTWPYSDDGHRYKEHPPQNCFQEAVSHEATVYHDVEATEHAIKAALASGYPLVLGIELYESFESHEVQRTGRVPLPNPTHERCLGGHAVCMVGFNDNERVWIMRNSWGEGWGDRGYFYLPYEYIVGNPRFCHGHLWLISKVSNAPVSHPPTKLKPHRHHHHHSPHHF